MKDAVILTEDESLFYIISTELASLKMTCGSFGERSAKLLFVDADSEKCMHAADTVQRKELLLISRTPESHKKSASFQVLKRPVCSAELRKTAIALQKRADEAKKPKAEKGNKIKLDNDSSCVLLDGERIKLSENELLVFSLLYENRGKPVSRDDIKNKLESNGVGCVSNTADVYICFLRKKLERNQKRLILTVRGHGYKLV